MCVFFVSHAAEPRKRALLLLVVAVGCVDVLPPA